jgi:hypothetical protein
MKISELLQENELPRPGSKLPSAASLDDAPEELEFDDEVDGEEGDDKQKAIDAFKSKAQEVVPGVWALSPSTDPGQDWAGKIDNSALSTISDLADALNLNMPSNDPGDNTDGMIYYLLDDSVFYVWYVPTKSRHAEHDSVHYDDDGNSDALSSIANKLYDLASDWTDNYDSKFAVAINRLLKHPRYAHKPDTSKISPGDLERIKFKKYMIQQKKYGDYPEKSYKEFRNNPEYKNFLNHGGAGRGQR